MILCNPQAIPSEYGAKRHPFFICKSSYWLGGGGILAWLSCREAGHGTAELSNEERAEVPELHSVLNENRDTGDLQCDITGASNIEVLDESSKVRVIASCLRKRYADGKLAVKKLSFAMVEGQITCLLGHNGAGYYLNFCLLEL